MLKNPVRFSERGAQLARRDEGADLPLHIALRARMPARVLLALLAAYPEAEQVTGVGWLPLHLAAQRRAPAEVAALLAA